MGTSATITMGDGDRLSVSGIPYGCTWTITETQAGGFRPSFTVNGGTVAAGGQSTGTIAVGDTLVAYTNTQTYILPETGGPGYAMVRTIGGIMTLTALVQLPKRKKRREEP